MHGFLNINKPAGITSHDVVARVRRLVRQKRVGHAGTLDPAATGVLVVAIGQATRLIEYVQDETRKRYTATIRLGETTTTDDAEGDVLETRPVPTLDAAVIETVLGQFRGAIQQVPPMYSALHHKGQRLYELARAGKTIDLPARPVHVYALDLVTIDTPLLTIDITCGKGTYVRSLARDIGVALGCGAHLAALQRTAVGAFVLEEARTLEQLEVAQRDGATSDMLLSAETAVRDWDAVTLDAEQALFVRHGRTLTLESDAQRLRAHTADGALLALLLREGEWWKPAKVFTWND